MAEIITSYHKVRGYECDFYGHVNNAVYLNYLEFARLEAMEYKDVPPHKLKESGVLLVIKQIVIDYKCPACAGDEIIIESSLDDIRYTNGLFLQKILRRRDNVVLAEAKVRWVCIDLDNKPVRIPEVICEAFDIQLSCPKK